MSFGYFEFPEYKQVSISHTENVYYYIRKVIHNLHNISSYFPTFNSNTYAIYLEDSTDELPSLHRDLIKRINGLCIGGSKEFRTELSNIIDVLYSHHETLILRNKPVATRCFKHEGREDWNDLRKYDMFSYYSISDPVITEYLNKFSEIASSTLQECADYVINYLDDFFIQHKKDPFNPLNMALYDILSKIGNHINKMHYIAESMFLLEHMFYKDLENSISEIPHLVTEYKCSTIQLNNASHLLFTSNYHNGTFSKNIQELRNQVEIIGDALSDSLHNSSKFTPIAFIKQSVYQDGIDVMETIRNDPDLGITDHYTTFQNIYNESDYEERNKDYDYFASRMVD